MTRLFIEASFIQNRRLTITGDEAQHLARVLRQRPGDEITLADGQGTDYHARITDVTGNRVAVEILAAEPMDNDPPVAVTLFAAVCKGDRFPWLLQKVTELGVARIVPLRTERTVVRLDEAEGIQRQGRWQRIVREAAQQSQRSRVPEVHLPLSLEAARAEVAAFDLAVVLHEGETGRSLRTVLREFMLPTPGSYPGLPTPSRQAPSPRVALFVGPEGGFSEAEVATLTRAGAIAVSLGPRILRAETAGLVAVALTIYEGGGLEAERPTRWD